MQFCCKLTLVSVCQKSSKYNAVWQSYCTNKRVQFFCCTVYKGRSISSRTVNIFHVKSYSKTPTLVLSCDITCALLTLCSLVMSLMMSLFTCKINNGRSAGATHNYKISSHERCFRCRNSSLSVGSIQEWDFIALKSVWVVCARIHSGR